MIRDARTYRIIGCAMAVHRTLGPGFLEAVYADALEVRFRRQGVPHQREVPFTLRYEGETLRSRYRADFVCYGEVLVEVKAQQQTGRPETAQVVNCLKASGLATGLLLNFGAGSLEHRRYVYTHRPCSQSAQLRGTAALRPLSGKSPSSEDSARICGQPAKQQVNP